MRIGIVGGRAELGMQVAAVAAATGGQVKVIELAPADGYVRDRECELLVVDPLTCPTPPGWVRGPGLGASAPTVVVAHLAGEAQVAREAAGRWAATTVLELPRGGRWLADLVRRDVGPPRSRVLAVIGATGGCGTSTLAIAAALAAGAESADCLLVDADRRSTGLDLPLGVADGLGARWADVPAQTDVLVADTLRACLPAVGGAYVLTGEQADARPTPLAAVVGTGREGFARTVVDAGRGPTAVGCLPGDGFVVVVPATLAGVVGARRILAELRGERVVLALRPTGWMPSDEVSGALDCPQVVSIPRVRGLPERAECGELPLGRVGRTLVGIGAQLWGALA